MSTTPTKARTKAGQYRPEILPLNASSFQITDQMLSKMDNKAKLRQLNRAKKRETNKLEGHQGCTSCASCERGSYQELAR